MGQLEEWDPRGYATRDYFMINISEGGLRCLLRFTLGGTMEWIILLGFAVFDYFGYNTIGRWSIIIYRIIQNAILIMFLLYALHAWFGWFGFASSLWPMLGWCKPQAALSFLFLWWAWWADIFYYVLYDVLKCFGYEDDALFGRVYVGEDAEEHRINGGAFEHEVLNDHVTWAWWTPLGLIIWAATGERERILTGVEILMQAFVMLGIYGIARAFF